jgi:small-conductance mechanosensitive channel/CRP-like cAMP-binding protein
VNVHDLVQGGLPGLVAAGLVLFALAAAVRLFSRNRVVRGRVRLTMLLAAVFIGLEALLAWATLGDELRRQVSSVAQLVFALGLINLVVLVLVNPLRVDRIPERFPTIVQDTIVLGLFVIVATMVMQEKFLTTSAVGAVVLGFAVQDTLGNMVSGLAIQIEKPFYVGHWIAVGEWEGVVTEITWRATKLRTRQGNLVVIPNGELSKQAITNYSEPALPTRLVVDVGVSYSVPPNEVKAAILEALADEPLLLESPPPAVHLVDFAASAITYRALFWINDFPMDEIARDRVRSAIYYVLHRRGIEIPFPIQVQYTRDEPTGSTLEELAGREALLRSLAPFAPLSDDDRRALVATAPVRLFGNGQSIVRQGEPGASAYIVCDGRVRVTVAPGNEEVAVIERGGYFGEMSLLTGEPRTATVRAVGDCRVMEVTADAFKQILQKHPAVVDEIGRAVAERRAGLEQVVRTAASQRPVVDAAPGLVLRVRKFFGL